MAAYNDFRELLARDDIDAVVIAVPDHWHALITIAAAKAGKDIYCEKPLSLTIREARAMVQRGAPLRPRLPDRQHAAVRCESSATPANWCATAASARVKKVNIGLPNNGQSLIGIRQEDRARRAGARRLRLRYVARPGAVAPVSTPKRISGNYSGGWRYVRDCSGGMMTDWGAHHFDIAQWGLGMDHSGPVEIHPPDGKDYPTLTYIYNIERPQHSDDAGRCRPGRRPVHRRARRG